MGIILRQGFKHSIVSFVATAVGLINVLFLYTYFLSKTELGFYNYIVHTAQLFSSFLTLGFSSVAIHFFNDFRKDKSEQGSFLFFLLLIPTLGFCIVALCGFLGREQLFFFYKDHPNVSLIIDYLFAIPALTFIMVIGLILTNYTSNFRRIVVPEILNNFFLKLCLPLLSGLYFFSITNFSTFIAGIVISYLLSKVGILVYLWWLGELKFNPSLRFLNRKKTKEISNYALFSVLSGAGAYIATKIDVFMVGTLLDMDNTAVYVIALYIATVIGIPLRSVFSIAGPIVAQNWKEKKLHETHKLYKQTSLNLLIVGVLLFIGIWTSIDLFFSLIPNGENYVSGKYLVLILGVAKLIDMVTSINAHIIIYSDFYKYNLLFSLLLAVLNIIFNILFIKQFQLGLTGVALATLSSMLLYNLIKAGFVWHKFKMHPFSLRTLWVVLIGGVSYFTAYLLPAIGNIWLDLLLNSFVVGASFIIGIICFKISPDISDFLTNRLPTLMK